MSRQTRTLLVLALISFGGMVSLLWMAQRYTDALNRDRPAATRPRPAALDIQGEVDRFIRVRGLLKEMVAAPEPPAQQDWREYRDRALAAAGMERERYLQVREMYRRWRSRRPDVAPAFSEAFNRRRDRLDTVDLGAHESLDL